MFITTRRHNEIVAKVFANAEATQKIAAQAIAALQKSADENADLRARLAVFTAPRARGAGGRFVKGEGARG